MGLRHYFTRRKRERELGEELRAHREMAEDAYRHELPDEEARFAAQRAMGNVTTALEDSRAVWNFQWLESLMQDVRYALRGFLKAPAFVLTVVGTIGLALGLNSALFTLFNAYVLRPFAVHDPYSLYEFTWITKNNGFHGFNAKEFEDFRRDNPAFVDALLYEFVMTRTEGKQVVGQIISDNAFTMLGTSAAIGRTLLPGDDHTLVLSDLAWRGKFGADERILGKKLDILGGSYEIVGVARREFTGLREVAPDFWIPLITTGPQAAEVGRVVGRLKPGTTPEQAKAALAVWSRQKTADLPEAQRAKGVHFESAATSIRINEPGFLPMIAPIVIAFGLVLLIACANVANILLARAMARQREIGVRLSLGAGRVRLVRQLLTESLLLSVPAAAAGIVVSQATIRLTHNLLIRTAPPIWMQIFRLIPMDPDYRVFLFVFATAVLSTLLFGLAPAIQATRPGLMYATRGDFSADIRPSKLRNALVVSQVTVCVLLLICSGVLLRAGLKAQAADVRMTTRGVMDLRFNNGIDAKMVGRLQLEPWIEAMATTWRAPLYGSLRTLSVAVGPHATSIRAGFNFVSPEYFDVLRIALVQGRNFTQEESRSEAAVAIVSEATAARLWPGQAAVSQTLRLDPNPKEEGWNKLPAYRAATIIGVAKDVISGLVGDGVDVTCLYFPTGPLGAKNASLLVRLKGEQEAARRALDAAISGSAQGVFFTIPMDEAVAMQIYPFRASAWVASALGGLALALSLSGIYGVLSYLVSQRTKEIGIRMALGASRRQVVGIVMSQSMRLAVTGVVIGAGLGLGVSRLFASQLQNVNTFDALAYAGSISVALVAALAAALVPSRRAATVDPVTALRCD